MDISRRVHVLLSVVALLGIVTVFVLPLRGFLYVMACLPLTMILILIVMVWSSRETRLRVLPFVAPGTIFFVGVMASLFYLSPNRLANKLEQMRQELVFRSELMIGRPLPTVSESQSNEIIGLEGRLQTAADFGLVNSAEPYLEAGLLTFVSRNFSDAVKLFGASSKFSARSGVITNDLGVAYYFNGSPDEAEIQVSKAIEYAKEPDVSETSKPALSVAYNNLGMVLKEKGKPDEALEKFRLALESASDQETILIIRLNQASVYQLEGDYEQAIKLADEALKTSGITSPLVAYAHRVKGIVQEERKEFAAASQSYEAAAALYEESGQKQELALTYHDLGNVYLTSPHPDVDRALRCFEQALSINRQLGNSIEIAFNYSSIALLYMEKGELDQAGTYAQNALEIFLQKDHPSGQAAVLDTLGSIFLRRGDKDGALELFQKALLITRQTRYRRGQAEVLSHLAPIYADKGQYRMARALLIEAEAIFEQSGARGEAERVRKTYEAWPYRPK